MPRQCWIVKATAWTVVRRTLQAVHIIFPAGHLETTHNGRRFLRHLITQQVVHARPSGNQRESAHPPPQPTPAASVQQATDSEDHDSHVTRLWWSFESVACWPLAAGDRIMLCGILWCGRRTRGAMVGVVDLDGRALRPRLLLIGFGYHQTKGEIPWKDCQRYCHALLMINET